jgi:hypothetical protein
LISIGSRIIIEEHPASTFWKGGVMKNKVKKSTSAKSKPASKTKLAKTKSAKTPALKSKSPSSLIDGRIKELGDWRGQTLAQIRELIKEAIPDVTEEWKWRGVPVWYQDGMICTGETYKSVVKVTFAKGAQLNDPAKLFNSSLEGNVRRAIDFHEGEKIKGTAFKALLREAVALNGAKK